MKDFRGHTPKEQASRKMGKDDTAGWQSQERRLARDTGGREQPRSGAHPILKGDVDAGTLLIEAKWTSKLSMSIKQDWLVKITREAQALDGKTPALAIEFQNMPPDVPRDWIMLPKAAFDLDGSA